MSTTKKKINKNISTHEDLLMLHDQISQQAWELMKKKNHDYSSVADPFQNFRAFGSYGVLVRLSDKIARLRTFEEKGILMVKDETILDTVQDICNYAIIYYAMCKEKGAGCDAAA